MTAYKWSTTAASNDTADSTVNLREGQSPSTINDSARAMMAAIAKWRDDQSGNLVTGGSSTAYTLTTNQVFTAFTDGISVTCRMSAANGASPTLNVDSLGAKSIASLYGTAIPTGRLKSGTVQTFVYDSTDDKWICHATEYGEFASGTVCLFYQASAPTGWTVSDADTDKAIRVVSGASGLGGAAGGTTAFTSVFTSRTIAQANLPNVNFTGTAASGGADAPATTFKFFNADGAAGSKSYLMHPTESGATGTVDISATSSGAHTHTVSVASGGSGTALDFAAQYISVIKAAKA